MVCRNQGSLSKALEAVMQTNLKQFCYAIKLALHLIRNFHFLNPGLTYACEHSIPVRSRSKLVSWSMRKWYTVRVHQYLDPISTVAHGCTPQWRQSMVAAVVTV